MRRCAIMLRTSVYGHFLSKTRLARQIPVSVQSKAKMWIGEDTETVYDGNESRERWVFNRYQKARTNIAERTVAGRGVLTEDSKIDWYVVVYTITSVLKVIRFLWTVNATILGSVIFVHILEFCDCSGQEIFTIASFSKLDFEMQVRGESKWLDTNALAKQIRAKRKCGV